jgi:hypothetical protein
MITGMVRIPVLLLLFLCPSCFLFPKFREEHFSYRENNQARSVKLVVPKGFRRTETKTDSSGNEEKYFYYPGGAFLYFVRDRDTAKIYQPINYGENISKNVQDAVFFKGIDSVSRYWRESRIPGFRSGYRYAENGTDWLFDSSLNYFSLQAGKGSL